MTAPDLVVLVPDIDYEYGLRSLLARTQSLGTRPFTFQILRHAGRDSGCRFGAAPLLTPFVNLPCHALVMYDREGGWGPDLTATELATATTGALTAAGWHDRAAAIVIDPELEAWVFGDSPHLAALLGWDNAPALSQWLREHGWLTATQTKPARPKEALEALRRLRSIRRSPLLFEQLAAQTSLRHCTDPAFLQFRNLLQTWFPPA